MAAAKAQQTGKKGLGWTQLAVLSVAGRDLCLLSSEARDTYSISGHITAGNSMTHTHCPASLR